MTGYIVDIFVWLLLAVAVLALLARRFFVPGIESETIIELPDDRLRLAAERDIDLLFSQLIEAVAQRASLIGVTRAAAKREDAIATRQRLAELKALRGAQYYSDELNKIRVLALEQAERKKDRLAARRIEELCHKSEALIEQYMPEDRLTAFIEEINDQIKTHEEAVARKAAEAARKPKPVVKRPPKLPSNTQRPGGQGQRAAAQPAKPASKPAPAKPAPAPVKPGRGVGL